MKDEDRKPWHRQPEETNKAWAAFQAYRDQNPEERNYDDIADKMDHSSKRYITRWANKYDWQDRIRAFDNYMTEQRIQQRREEHREKIKDLAEQQRRLHRAATTNAALALEQSQRILKEVKDNESKRPDFQTSKLPSLLRAASDIAETSGEMQARALGLDKVLERLDHLGSDEE